MIDFMRDMPNARFVGKLPDGTRVFRCHVRATWGCSIDNFEGNTRDFTILASSAAEACNHVRDLFAQQPQTSIVTFGPKGGKVERWVGWDSAIGAALLNGGFYNGVWSSSRVIEPKLKF